MNKAKQIKTPAGNIIEVGRAVAGMGGNEKPVVFITLNGEKMVFRTYATLKSAAEFGPEQVDQFFANRAKEDELKQKKAAEAEARKNPAPVVEIDFIALLLSCK